LKASMSHSDPFTDGFRPRLTTSLTRGLGTEAWGGESCKCSSVWERDEDSCRGKEKNRQIDKTRQRGEEDVFWL
jgi:hypothetical protein